MANIARGEASFTTSAGQTLTLVVDFNALAEAEYAVDMGANDILAGLSKGRIKAMRGITLGALARQHPGMSMEDVDTLLMGEDAGPLGNALMKAVEGAFPKPEAAAGANPPAPPGSTGTSSRRTGRQKG
jgi:hypothetical protein